MPNGKSKQFRRRRKESTDEEDGGDENNEEEVSDILEATKELQKVRKRQMGVNAASLATGVKLTKADEMVMDNDPFKVKTGGLVSLRNVKDRNRDRTYEDVDRDVTNLGSTFSVETNRRDEDSELTAYVESELKKIRGEKEEGSEVQKSKIKTAEDQLYQLPDHLKLAAKDHSEEMLSNQMLSGIPEIDLGIETKIKNIERTEEAKQKLIKEMSQKKENRTSFVPTNMAVNYVQHKRFMHSENFKHKTKEPEPERVQPVVGDAEKKLSNDVPKRKAGTSTDDFHYEKFRKASRRY
uniref:Uncharacterized protein C9orf78 homolog n=1 Tax=Phallusia mammillata TaxID=59560 RepID=A0A6F9D7Y7_9ASCI|nr:uncharacterized protein C9orf78 homolog [Phallusia mammillata]